MYLIEKHPIAKILEIAKHKETNTNIIIYGSKGDPWIFKPFVRDQLAPSVLLDIQQKEKNTIKSWIAWNKVLSKK